ncbi:MAG: sensor histidine kinase [Phycisphaerales bacterium]|nr:sensor histidine kinase [Phycisphaerales bacterium]
MTRRIASAILRTVWATLIAGGLIAYLTTRSLLLADLDKSLVDRARALPALSKEVEANPRLEESAGDRYVIYNRLGQTVGRLPPSDAGTPPPAVLNAGFAKLGDGKRVRRLQLRFTPRDGGEPVIVVYSGSAERFDQVLSRLALALAVFGLFAGGAAAVVAVAASRSALRPLRDTTDAITAIDERRLDQRIAADNLPSELRPVAARLNEMLGRLERAFKQRKQFLADASHELRTPVAALVTTIEVALRRPRGPAELTETLRTCLSDARMLRELVQTLLEHARSETDALKDPAEPFDATALLHQCADVAGGLAALREVTVVRSVASGLTITSEAARLRGIVMNLLGNAVEHNRVGGRVELRAHSSGVDLEVVIEDTGLGIAADHLPHVFQPFYRASMARAGPEATDHQHLGLGLFLVDSHIKALGGECRIESEQGVGTTVHVRLPGVVLSQSAVLEATGA